MASGMTSGPTSHLSDVWFSVTDLEVVSGSGCVVTTGDGTEYLDFSSGIAVTSTGHCHPKVVAAIADQAGRFLHAQANVYRHNLMNPLADRLAEITPDPIEVFFLANSGAEATEGGVKLARQATGRQNVIVFEGSFHGRSMLAMAMTTSKSGYRAGYQPLPAGIFVAPFPTALKFGGDIEAATDHCLAALRHLLVSQTAPAETAAIVLEPVLGEGGYYAAPPRFLRGVEEICRDHGILFVADEIQTGFARTGRMFAVEHAGVRPDILLMAKGIASGFPISAIGASAEVMSRWPRGSHGGTYGGNPIGCAAALATIDVLTEPGFLDHVEARGQQLRAGLEKAAADDAGVAEVRGLGLMVAVELVDPATGRPDGARVSAVLRSCLEEGQLILMGAGSYGNIVRFMPPLIVSEAEVDRAVDAFAAALRKTRG
ncbi:aspartate aminotransferase family protein [Sporichthya polymorpha]|uniref:aspartate aminotransferase family protein n=1 Tax=Sporichthya polymorpha TaxID=35751 RepID=UPI0003A73AA0|nr:aminotransferase class III-fold pyridoxal phosphate-dependent enzyme [Sporichthya polymorpha]